MMDLAQAVVALHSLSAEAMPIAGDEALANYLSAFVLGKLPVSTTLAEQGYHPRRQRPRFELFLPLAGARDFPRCSPIQVRKLALCSAYGLLYCGLMDAFFDEPDQARSDTLILAQHAFSLLHVNLMELLAGDNRFWSFLPTLLTRFFRAVQEERERHRDILLPYPYEEFCRLAKDKMAIALGNPTILATLDGTPERIPLLCDCWEEINVAVVIYDDIKDWEADLRQGNYTFLLTQVLLASGASKENVPAGDETAHLIAWSGIVEELYATAAAHLNKAASLAAVAGAPALAGLATERAETLLRYRHRLLGKKAGRLVLHLTIRGIL